MSGKGYIKLYRQIQDCWIWDTGKFDKRSAWIDLLILANHSEKKIVFNGDYMIIAKGQYLTSIRNLASRWGWSVSTVSEFLSLLEEDLMIKKESDKFRTLLTIVNYESFQDVSNTNRTDSDTPTDTTTDTPDDTRAETNNTLNTLNIKEKEIPKGISQKKNFTPPTINEISEYCRERKNNVNPEKFFDFYECKGWMVGKNKMKDWKAAVRTWERGDNKSASSKSIPVSNIMEYEIDNGDTHPQIPPYYGFPKEWFDGDDPVRDRFMKIKQKQNFSIGVTDDTIYSPDELWDKFILRKRGYEYEQQFGFNDCP